MMHLIQNFVHNCGEGRNTYKRGPFRVAAGCVSQNWWPSLCSYCCLQSSCGIHIW